MSTRRALSRKAAVVLNHIVEHGPLPSSRAILAIAGTERALFSALIVLHDRMLVRWDAQGVNIRATRAGRELMGQAYYRQLIADPSRLHAPSV